MTETENVDLSKLRISREQQHSDRPRRSKSGWIVLAVIIILAIAGYIGFKNLIKPVDTVDLTTVSLVSTAQANASLTASGYIVAQRKAAIASKATGRLVYLGVEEGDLVQKNQIIGRIESSDVGAALTQAKANLEVYKADFNDAKQSLDRAKTLMGRQLISQSEVDAAQARFDKVSASITLAEAGIAAAEVQVENTNIRAPFDGTVLTKNADVGEVVAPFGAGASSKVAVVTIADMNSLQVEADVSESNIERINPNQPCEIVLDAYPEKRYAGFVHKIVPTADRAKATVLTKIRFSEKDERVLPEMSAKVFFLSKKTEGTGDSKPKLLVSQNAIVKRDGKTVAFLYSGETVKEVSVTVGQTFGSNVEILQGLSAGDKVVAHPAETLQSGVTVKVKE